MVKPIDYLSNHAFIPIGENKSQRRTAEVLARHEVSRKAIEAGQTNEPASDDPLPHPIELELTDEAQCFIDHASRVARTELSARADLMRSTSPLAIDTTLQLATIRRAVAEAMATYGDDLDRANRDHGKALGDLRAFEAQNGLKPHSARYGDDVWMFVTTLIAFIFGHAVIDGLILQDAQGQGLLGGLLLALGVGVSNILLGLGTGFLGWRFALHVNPRLRVLGIGLTAVLMALALNLQLALADLREAASTQGNAHIDFLIILKPLRWFAFTSVPPFVLFAIGISTFIATALKARGGHAFGLCSLYPGHDSHDRRVREREADLDDAKDNLKSALLNAFDGERAKLRAAHDAALERLVELRRAVAEGHQIARSVGDSVEDENGRLQLWLRTWRDLNRRVRTTPAPASFDRYPEAWHVARMDTAELDALLAEAERVVAENGARIAALEESTLQDQVAMLEGLGHLRAESAARALRDLIAGGVLPETTPVNTRRAA